MSGKERSLQINNFSGINTTKWRLSDKRRNLFIRMSKEIYNRLELLSPCFLRKDVFKYAKANSLYAESLQSRTDGELLRLKMAQLRALPQSQKRILQQEKSHRGKLAKKYNWPQISRLTRPQESQETP